jgi:hypothetical protein
LYRWNSFLSAKHLRQTPTTLLSISELPNIKSYGLSLAGIKKAAPVMRGFFFFRQLEHQTSWYGELFFTLLIRLLCDEGFSPLYHKHKKWRYR